MKSDSDFQDTFLVEADWILTGNPITAITPYLKQILSELKEAGGFLPLNDKTSPG